MPIRNQQMIRAETALAMTHAALSFAKAEGIAISLAICGSELQPILLLRGDGSPPHSLETAKRKAQTAASRGQESGLLNEAYALSLPLASGNLLTNLRGGLPLLVGEVCVGGVGVGGGSPEQDVAVALVAVQAVLLFANSLAAKSI